MLAVIAAAMAVYVISVVSSVLLFHFRPIQLRVRALTLINIVCTPLIVPFLWLFRDLTVSSTDMRTVVFAIYTIGVFTLLWFGYLQFYFSFERSPSLRFLIETMTSPKGRLTPDELAARFSFDDVIRRRIAQMVDVGMLQTREENGQLIYFNSEKAQKVGKFCRFVKDFMNLGDGG